MPKPDALVGALSSSPFTLRQLECFLAVAETGSITAAAAVLHASDSAVSDALTALERALGANLLHRRRSRGANLTSDGLAVLPIAHRVVAEAEDLRAAVGRESSVLTGPVRVGAVDTLAPVLLPALIGEARERHAALRVQFRTGEQPALLDALANADLDVVLAFDIDVPPELERRRLFSTEACIVVAESHPIAGRRAARLEEIADEPMILLDILASRVHTLELMSSRSITPRIALRTHNYELCRSLVGRGLGYTLLMRRDIDPMTWDGGRVVFVPIEPAPRTVDALAVWVSGDVPARLAAIIDVAVSVGGSPPPR
ncbi:LysR substrate-binding domain-containing protein [Tsukamurella soli]|uniref:LysR family transcriptional regulator n=1 Tax=Tsukamurella soli TaxID=644556 RepID=A0ABP8JRW2_9ACTN